MGDESLRNHLLGKMHRLKARAQEILDENERLGKEETPEQVEEFKSITAEIEGIQVEVKKLDDREEMRKTLESLGTVSEIASTETQQVEAKSVGEAVVNSPEYKAVVETAKRTGTTPKFTLPTIELKAAGDPVLSTDGNNSDAIRGSWDPTLRAPGLFQPPLRLADLFTVAQVDGGPTITYPIVTTRTKPTGNPTAEGVAKKGATFAFDVGTATLEKNTAFSGFSDEMLQDAPRLVAYIDSQMRVMVLQVEEDSIFNVLDNAVSQTADGTGIGGSNAFDAIRESMAVVVQAGGTPNAIGIHPNDSAGLDVQRALDGDGGYFGGGPVGGPRGSWWGGLRIVESVAFDEGTAIVGDYSQGATLYRKGGLRVDTSNSHDDYFERDLVAIRAELRSILCVHNPEVFVKVDVGAS